MERFEILERSRFELGKLRDRETGANALLPLAPTHQFFLDRAAMRGMALRVREWKDARLAEVLSIDPVVVAGPPKKAPTGTLEEYVDASIELLDVLVRLQRGGIHSMGVWAWVERRDARLCIVVPAPALPPGLHSQTFSSGWARGVGRWLNKHVGKRKGLGHIGPRDLRKALDGHHENHADLIRAFVRAVSLHASSEAKARLPGLEQAAIATPTTASPPMDFDHAITLGEEEKARGNGHDPLVDWALAAAWHHRGCVRWSSDRTRAVADVDRALELDRHTQYFTTRALFAEALGDPRAGEFHDLAVKCMQQTERSHFGGGDSDEKRDRDDMRAFRARAAWRSKSGDAEGATADLQAARQRETPRLAP